MPQELLQRYLDANKMHSFEGARGVSRMKQVMREVCGYSDDWGGIMQNFFEDNPGAMEAVVQWVGEQRSTEWTANLEALVGSEDDVPEDDAADEDWIEP